ncbi:unnamed protein product, partial [Ectocarpus sp. 12 AP-2014]
MVQHQRQSWTRGRRGGCVRREDAQVSPFVGFHCEEPRNCVIIQRRFAWFSYVGKYVHGAEREAKTDNEPRGGARLRWISTRHSRHLFGRSLKSTFHVSNENEKEEVKNVERASQAGRNRK